MGTGKSPASKGSGTNRKIEAKTYALFHGSPNADIDEFDITKAGKNTSSGEHFLFFTDSKQEADEFSYERLETDSMFFNQKGKKGRVYEVDVTMKKPLDLSNPTAQDIKNIISLSNGELTEDMVKHFSAGNNQILKAYLDLDKISNYGYDGFIANMYTKASGKPNVKEYAVLDAKQTKIKK